MTKSKQQSWMNRMELTNGEVLIIILQFMITGFTWAYLHWGLNIPW